MAQAKLAFFHLGQVDVELIEPIGEPSTWKEQFDKRRDSLHHIAFQIDRLAFVLYKPKRKDAGPVELSASRPGIQQQAPCAIASNGDFHRLYRNSASWLTAS